MVALLRKFNVKRIIIDNGEIFDGTHEQFKDCFFDNADEDSITNFCKKNNWELVIQYGN